MDFSLIATIIAIGGPIILYLFGKYRQGKLEAQIIEIQNRKRRELIDSEIKNLNKEIQNKREAYEKAKNNVYDILNKRNNPPK